jgi:hypothetical protein
VRRGRKPRIRRRCSIGEWYGDGFEVLSGTARSERAGRELDVDGLTGTPCPFQVSNACNKKGGICSLRFYEQTADGPISGSGPLITTCPNRFLEANTIFPWIGETILETKEPIVLSQIGFLDRVSAYPSTQGKEGDEEPENFIGRIDNVLVHPSRRPIDWCALELQAVYFSGDAMKKEFMALARERQEHLPFPAANRRPDFRSSGPKRLLPQLQTKVPTIRTWGKKMAVVIDEAFFGSMVGLEREKHLSNSEIAWFVVRYDAVRTGWKLLPQTLVFTKLDTSIKALTGGVPLSRENLNNN